VKKILINIIFIFLFSPLLKGQEIQLISNYNPNINALGGIISYAPLKKLGGYIGYSQGYKYGLRSREPVIGVNIPIHVDYDFHLMVGLVRNYYTEINTKEYNLNLDAISQINYTIGFNIPFNKDINIIIISEIPNMEVIMGIGININTQRKRKGIK